MCLLSEDKRAASKKKTTFCVKKNTFLFGSSGIFKISVNPQAGRKEGLGGETCVSFPESTEINTGGSCRCSF